MTIQGRVPIEHRSLQPKRLRRSEYVNCERLFAAAWRKWNRDSNILGYVLAPDGISGPVDYTKRDAALAASIVQRFGTNVGRAFIDDVMKRYDALVEEQRDVQRLRWWWRFERVNAPLRRPRYRVLKAQLEAVRERLKRSAAEKEKHR